MAENTIGTAYVQIEPSAKGIAAKTQKALGGEMDIAGAKSGASLGSALSSSLTKYISAAAIGTAISKSLTEGAALQQSIGGVETLYSKSADIVKKNANDAWRTAGISANEYMEQSTSYAASLLQSLGGDTAKAAKYADMAIIDMADNSAKFGTDLVMIQNAYSGFSRGNFTMLDNLKLGFAGTKEGMQDLLNKATELTGKDYSIDSLSDIYDAIHAIQTELGVTGTTAKEGTETLSGSLMSLKASATNLLGSLTIGENVGDSMRAMIESLGTFVAKNLIPALGNIVKGIPELFTSINWVGVSKSLLGQVSTFVDSGIEWALGLAQGMADGMPSFIKKIPEFISNIADIINNNAPKLLTAGVKIGGTLALGLIKAIPTFVKSIPALFKAAVKVWLAVGWVNLGKSAVMAIKNGVSANFGSLINTIKSKFGTIKNAITHPFETAKNAIKGIIDKIKSFFPISAGKVFSGLKIPHFDFVMTHPGGIKELAAKGLGLSGVPNLKVNWYATGGIFDQPTIAGIGEGRSPEAVVPLDMFWAKMDAIANAIATPQQSASAGNVTIMLDGEVIAKSTVNYVNGQITRYGVNPINA